MLISRLYALILAAVCALVLSQGGINAGPENKKQVKPESPDQTMVQVTYAVADLVVPVPNCWAPSLPGLNAPAASELKASQPSAERAQTLEGKLIDLLCQTIDPKSWNSKGGIGTIRYFPAGKSLVVEQTRDNHGEIADLLKALRRLQEVEASLEVRLVSAPAETVRHVMDLTACKPIKSQGPNPAFEGAFLGDRQARGLLALLQSQPKVDVMQLPKITVFNGQAASIQVTDAKYFLTDLNVVPHGTQLVFQPHNTPLFFGTVVDVTPVVSADRRSVRLQFNLAHNKLDDFVPARQVKIHSKRLFVDDGEDQPIVFAADVQQPTIRKWTLDTHQTIPDGTTLICRLGEEKVETLKATLNIADSPNHKAQIAIMKADWAASDPALQPKGGCADRCGGKKGEERELFLLVTPRVVITPAEEQIYMGTVPPVGSPVVPKPQR